MKEDDVRSVSRSRNKRQRGSNKLKDLLKEVAVDGRTIINEFEQRRKDGGGAKTDNPEQESFLVSSSSSEYIANRLAARLGEDINFSDSLPIPSSSNGVVKVEGGIKLFSDSRTILSCPDELVVDGTASGPNCTGDESQRRRHQKQKRSLTTKYVLFPINCISCLLIVYSTGRIDYRRDVLWMKLSYLVNGLSVSLQSCSPVIRPSPKAIRQFCNQFIFYYSTCRCSYFDIIEINI